MKPIFSTASAGGKSSVRTSKIATVGCQRSAIAKGFSLPRFFILPLFLSLLATLSSYAQTTPPTITVNGAPGDWPAVLRYTGYTTGYKLDPNSSNDDSFTQGSKDTSPICQVGSGCLTFDPLGNTNNKGDITNTGAALIGTKLYFFGDRVSINGDAQIGFWFYKLQVAPIPATGKFSYSHSIGDLLILSNFTNGGGVSKIRIFEWVGSGGNAKNAPQFDSLVVSPTANFAIVNAGSEAVPTYHDAESNKDWTYGTPRYAKGAFFEGVVDLTTLRDLQGNPLDACFSSFLLETRNSASISASLQDLAADNFDVTPATYTPTATPYCFSPTGTVSGTVTLPSSQVNITYQLKIGTTPVQTSKPGTGNALVWTGVAGSASPGTAYTIVGTRNGTGCSSTSGPVRVIENPLPTITPGTYGPYCINAAAVTLGGTPSGGTWSGTGVTPVTGGGYRFTPATAGAGSFTLTYSYTDGNSCSNSGTTSVTVYALPVLTPDDKTVCQGGSVGLTALPTGGTWSGAGVSGSTFTSAASSSTLATGDYTVTYSYTNSTTGCSNTKTAKVTVNARPAGPGVTYIPPGCLETTFSVQVNNPVAGTVYKLNGGACTGCTQTGTNSSATPPTVNPVIFSGIAAGAGFSITATIGECMSDPTDCSNYLGRRLTSSPAPGNIVPASLQSIETEVYPNPTSKEATINFSVPKTGHVLVSVYDAMGRPVATLYDGEALAGEQRSVVLKGSTLAAGTYTYRVVVGGKTKTNRVILET